MNYKETFTKENLHQENKVLREKIDALLKENEEQEQSFKGLHTKYKALESKLQSAREQIGVAAYILKYSRARSDFPNYDWKYERDQWLKENSEGSNE